MASKRIRDEEGRSASAGATKRAKEEATEMKPESLPPRRLPDEAMDLAWLDEMKNDRINYTLYDRDGSRQLTGYQAELSEICKNRAMKAAIARQTSRHCRTIVVALRTGLPPPLARLVTLYESPRSVLTTLIPESLIFTGNSLGDTRDRIGDLVARVDPIMYTSTFNLMKAAIADDYLRDAATALHESTTTIDAGNRMVAFYDRIGFVMTQWPGYEITGSTSRRLRMPEMSMSKWGAILVNALISTIHDNYPPSTLDALDWEWDAVCIGMERDFPHTGDWVRKAWNHKPSRHHGTDFGANELVNPTYGWLSCAFVPPYLSRSQVLSH